MTTRNKTGILILCGLALGAVFLTGYIAGANRYSLYVAQFLAVDESTGNVLAPHFTFSDREDIFPSYKETLFPASCGVTIEFEDGRNALVWLGVRSSSRVELPFYLDGYEKKNLTIRPLDVGFLHYPNSRVEKITLRKEKPEREDGVYKN